MLKPEWVWRIEQELETIKNKVALANDTLRHHSTSRPAASTTASAAHETRRQTPMKRKLPRIATVYGMKNSSTPSAVARFPLFQPVTACSNAGIFPASIGGRIAPPDSIISAVHHCAVSLFGDRNPLFPCPPGGIPALRRIGSRNRRMDC